MKFNTLPLDGEVLTRQRGCRHILPSPQAADASATLATSEHPARRVRARPWPAAGFLARGLSLRTTFPETFLIPSGILWSSAIRLQLRGQPRIYVLAHMHRIPLVSPCGYYRSQPWHPTMLRVNGQIDLARERLTDDLRLHRDRKRFAE